MLRVRSRVRASVLRHAPLKNLATAVLKLIGVAPLVFRRRGARATIARVWRVRESGFWSLFHWAHEVIAYEQRNDPERYERWKRSQARTQSRSTHHSVDVVVPVPRWEDAAKQSIASIRRQTHENWRLWLVSSEAFDDELLADDRIGWASGGGTLHHMIAVGAGAGVASHILLLHHACILGSTGIADLLCTATATSADVVYADEDDLVTGAARLPYLKPGFSIDLLRAEDYVGPVFLVRRSFLQRVLCEGDSSWVSPFDLLLRAYEYGARVERVPSVVVHWQCSRDRRHGCENTRLVHEHLVRLYGRNLAEMLADTESSRPPDRLEGLSSIIIPTRDRTDLLSNCLDGIYRHPQQTEFEVVILNNGSREKTSLEWLANAASEYPNLSVVEADYAFSWSRLNNHAVAYSRGDVLVFLNNDTEVLSPRWLDRLVMQSRRSDVGTVGALLLYPDGTIQHAGVVIGIGRFADHVYARCPAREGDRHAFVSPLLPRNVLASTGACLAMRRQVFEQLGPFDERLAICADIEMCLRAHRRGLLNVYDSRVIMYHHEYATRRKATLGENELAQARPFLEEFIVRGDPFYNPNLSLQLRYPTLGTV